MSKSRYIAETPRTRGETFVFHMPLYEFSSISRDRLNQSLESAAKANVRRNYDKRLAHVFVIVLDFEVRQDFLRDIAVIIVVYEYKATVVNTTNKVLWNRYKLSHPELNFYTRNR